MVTQVNDEIKHFILDIIRNDSILGKMLDPENMRKLMEAFVKTLSENNISLSSQDLKNPEVKDALQLGCRTQAAKMLNPGLNIDMKPALKPLVNAQKKEEEKEEDTITIVMKFLKDLFTLKLTKRTDKKPTEEEEKDLEKELQKIARDLLKDKKGSSIAKGCLDALVRESAARSKQGVANPGEEFRPVEEVSAGNQSADLSLLTGGKNFLSSYDDPENTVDPAGIRAEARVNALADDFISKREEEEQRTEPTQSKRGPGSLPRLTPPGTKD